MLRHALKEWAVVCRALNAGKQTIVLRKGGIADDPAAFRADHTRFWLYPTYAHEHRAAIKPEARPDLDRAEAERPAPGTVRLTLFAEPAACYHVRELAPLLFLNHLHVLSEETVRTRYSYRTPGLFVLALRVYRLPDPVLIPEGPDYSGCRSWLELRHPLPTAGAQPVLSDAEFQSVLHTLEPLLREFGLA